MNRPVNNASLNPTTNVCRTSSNLEVYFYDYGGIGPTILFAHAASFHGRIWDQTISDLLSEYRCVTFDFRGHGNSSGTINNPSPLDQTWESLFADIPEVIDQLNPGGPIFGAGHSLGGTGLIFSQLQDPTLFDALWVYEPIIVEPNPAFGDICEDLARGAEKRKTSFISSQEAVDNFSGRPPFDTIEPRVLTDYVDHGTAPSQDEVRLRCLPDTEAATYRNAVYLDIFDQTQHIEIDVCVVTGSIDPFAIQAGQNLSANIPSATIISMAELGHLGPLESPSQAATSITEFFGSH